MVVSDLERFKEIKDGRFRDSRVGGLWWALDEKTQTTVREKRHRAHTGLWWALI